MIEFEKNVKNDFFHIAKMNTSADIAAWLFKLNIPFVCECVEFDTEDVAKTSYKFDVDLPHNSKGVSYRFEFGFDGEYLTWVTVNDYGDVSNKGEGVYEGVLYMSFNESDLYITRFNHNNTTDTYEHLFIGNVYVWEAYT